MYTQVQENIIIINTSVLQHEQQRGQICGGLISNQGYHM